MVITDLPIEILEHIVAALDSPTDLQNLAAVCTLLRSIIEPNHTQFHVIRTPLNSPLWEKLAEYRSYAQNVRILEVQGDYRGDVQVIPTIFSELEVPPVPDLKSFENVEAVTNYFTTKNDTDLIAERILVSALKGMSGLTSFQWARTPPLINRDQEDDIWITLAKHCPSLNVIDVYDCEKPYDSEPLLDESDDPAYQRPTHNPNFYLFKDLKSFTFSTEAFNFGSSPHPDVKKCAKMLVERCPNLELLSLEYVLDRNPDTKTAFASPLLSGPPWNSLCQLTLYNFEFISTELSLFLASHPTIESLSLFDCKIDPFLVLPPHALPRLGRLLTDRGAAVVVNAILDSTIAIPRPLQNLQGFMLDDVFLDRLQRCGSGPTLNTLVPVGDGGGDFGRLITRLSAIAPNLEQLEFRSGNQDKIDRTLYPVFGQFPHLKALNGIQVISSSCEPASENTERIRALVTLCPKLRCIGGQIDPPNTDFRLAVFIERHGSHRIWTLYHRTEGELSVYEDWGARGQGSFEL